MSAWLYLAAAIALEVVATFCLKMSDGFEKAAWGVASMALYTGCFWVLAPALKTIPVGVAYAIWAASASPRPRSSASSPSTSGWASRRPASSP